MSKKTLAWIIAAISLILIGCFLFGGVMSMLNWDFSKLSTVKYREKEHEIRENFENISIVADTDRITFVPSQDGKVRVVCYEQENMVHTVTVSDGTLTIDIEDSRRWYEYIGIHFGSPKITVYLPGGTYGTFTLKSDTGDVELPADFAFESISLSVSTADVKCLASATGEVRIRTSTGSIVVEKLSASTLDLSVSTGRVTVTDVTCQGELSVTVSTGKATLKNVTCQSFVSEGNTGDLTLSRVAVREKLSVTRSTGNVKFDRCDAGQIFVQTDTGDVTGSLLTDKVFFAQTDTGRVDVPKTAAGGRCEITTDTGDIKITINK